jgi:hypothetical protein
MPKGEGSLKNEGSAARRFAWIGQMLQTVQRLRLPLQLGAFALASIVLVTIFRASPSLDALMRV